MPILYFFIFTAWHYASAICVLCLCVFVSVTSRSCTKKAKRILAWMLLLTYAMMFSKEIRVTSKIRVLPVGTLSKMLDLQFRHGGRSRVNALNKSIGTTTMDCLSCVGQVRLTVLQTVLGPTLSAQVINKRCVARSIGDSWYLQNFTAH